MHVTQKYRIQKKKPTIFLVEQCVCGDIAPPDAAVTSLNDNNNPRSSRDMMTMRESLLIHIYISFLVWISLRNRTKHFFLGGQYVCIYLLLSTVSSTRVGSVDTVPLCRTAPSLFHHTCVASAPRRVAAGVSTRPQSIWDERREVAHPCRSKRPSPTP